MCGKPNPAGADWCQHCQARLIPLEASTPIQPVSPEPDDLEEYRLEKNEPLNPSGINQGEDEPVPTWLTDLRQNIQDDQLSEQTVGQSFLEGSEPQSDRALPDWLKTILPEPEDDLLVNPPIFTSASDVELGPIEEEEPDWLRKISHNEFPARHENKAEADASIFSDHLTDQAPQGELLDLSSVEPLRSESSFEWDKPIKPSSFPEDQLSSSEASFSDRIKSQDSSSIESMPTEAELDAESPVSQLLRSLLPVEEKPVRSETSSISEIQSDPKKPEAEQSPQTLQSGFDF